MKILKYLMKYFMFLNFMKTNNNGNKYQYNIETKIFIIPTPNSSALKCLRTI